MTSNLPSILKSTSTNSTPQFYFWVIQNQGAVPHPIHLHGHDFYILGATNTTETTNPMSIFTGSADDMKKLNFGSPMRRDVATLPGNGWLVIAFHTNNPGMWLMHCHVSVPAFVWFHPSSSCQSRVFVPSSQCSPFLPRISPPNDKSHRI